MHPPLTDFPIAAYVIAAVFDVISVIGGSDHTWARELWHAATFTFIAGAAVSVLAALTGLWDAWKSSEAGTQARRTVNAHATIMVTVTVLAIANIIWRLNDYHVRNHTPGGIMALSVVIAVLVSLGGDVRRHARVRLRLQRRDGGRLPGVAPVGRGRAARTARVTAGRRLSGKLALLTGRRTGCGSSSH
jgi:uncharacterized membrane protein